MRHLHDGVILLLRPESFSMMLSCANWRFCYLNHPAIIKFKYKSKNEMNSGLSSKRTSSCKYLITGGNFTAMMTDKEKTTFKAIEKYRYGL